MGKTTVSGHAGILLWAELAGLETLIFQGRRHWYEGIGWEPVAFPVYLLKKLGARAVILTNSAGGIRFDLRGGTLMAIEDHINGMGVNPLPGRHDDFWGKRFVDQTGVYDPGLLSLLKAAAHKKKIPLKQGVYIAVSGPTYETPAEIRAFRRLGADAVGMSTVPEAILANAAGLRVLGISLISNPAADVGNKPISHEEVCKTGKKNAGAAEALVREFWTAMSAAGILS